MESAVVIIVHEKKFLKTVKTALEHHKILDHTRKISKDGLVYTTISEIEDLEKFPTVWNIIVQNRDSITLEKIQVEKSRSVEILNIIDQFLREFADQRNIQKSHLPSKLPKKWSIYPPMVLFGANTFDDQDWGLFFHKNNIHENEFYRQLLDYCFKDQEEEITHIAINKPIPLSNIDSARENIKRIPLNILPIYGDFGPEPSLNMIHNPTSTDLQNAFWCHSKQNGVYQYWAPRFIMFSRGNIKEKIRIFETFDNIAGNDIIDLYAGIGYFTLCYLKKDCRKLYAWELNPWSIEGLKKGCEKNGFKYQVIRNNMPWIYDPTARIYIFNESNEFAPQRFGELSSILATSQILRLTHINLGLLPSSKPSWEISMEIIKNFKISDLDLDSIVHVHENVHIREFDSFIKSTESELSKLVNNTGSKYNVKYLHLERIKTYAPDVWHVCVDYSVGSLA
ncbi:tRNA(Phe) (4-demethylwyosine(37)-C(7)) aminocarboxypropyltransferase [Saccharomycopsis crataegensis]|uniref:tRNA wybutosine-synthesizing protein 2 n=1 Tax=Saccharomycopsis crataegensis TaxID=43959 RepID=A0AAV5QEC7_9ASCO|nr:tRNA(Phe) (4-demethylwyosine(37)-C(7)) aminocarboxypropyltransferase [Saccharomycopsis crataegensis]